MKAWSAPAIPAALAALLGAGSAAWLTNGSLLALVALAGGGLALGGRVGRGLACFALGALSVLARAPAPAADWCVEERPVTARVWPLGPWRSGPYGWSVAAELESLRGRGEVRPGPARVWLSVPFGPEPPGPEPLEVRGLLRPGTSHANQPVLPAPWPQLRVKSWSLVRRLGPGSAFDRLSAWCRQRVEGAIERGLAGDESPAAGLVRAFVLGDTSRVPETWRRALARFGLAHLLAVSGFHVTLLAGMAWALGAFWPRPVRLVLVAVAVAAFVLVAGPRPATLRAAAMAALLLAALLLRRSPQAGNALGVFVLATVVVAPANLADLGWRLSVAATAALVLASRPLARRWSALPAAFSTPLAGAAAAQLATLPFSQPAFHLFVPLSALWNLLAVPWSALFLAASLAWTGLALVSVDAARCMAPALTALGSPVGWLAATPPSPWIAVPAVLGPAASCLLAGALWAALWWPRRLALPGLSVAVLLLWPPAPPTEPRLVLFDVGQGEALLLGHGHRAVLVDGGGWSGGDFASRVLLPALAGQGVRRLEAAISTHPDADHCGGLVGIAELLPIAQVLTAPGFLDAPCIRALSHGRGVPTRTLVAGDRFALGAFELEVLHPAPGGASRSTNDASLVLAARVLGHHLLLTGDAEAGAEREMLARSRPALGAHVLKVGHHGSRTSTSRAFLAAVDPAVALISAGRDNRFGHPHPEVVRRLEREGVRVFSTPVHGMVELRFLSEGRWRLAFGRAAIAGP